MLKLTCGWDQNEVSRIVRETLDEVVEPIIYAEALELLEQHQASGRKTYLVSASPEEIVQPLAEYLGVDGAIASRAVVDLDGRYTGEMAFYAYGPFKAEAMRDLASFEGIDLSASYAYSDSYTDVPMLEAVGHPVVVNADRVLARLARDRGWESLQFTPARPATRPGAGSEPSHGGRVDGCGARRHRCRCSGQALRAQRRPAAWVDQASRSRLAAMRPRPTRMARISSFFTAPILPTRCHATARSDADL